MKQADGVELLFLIPLSVKQSFVCPATRQNRHPSDTALPPIVHFSCVDVEQILTTRQTIATAVRHFLRETHAERSIPRLATTSSDKF